MAPLEGMRALRFENSGTSKTDTSMRSPAPSVRSLTSVVAPLASPSRRATAATAVGLAAGDDGTAAVGPVGCDRPAHDVNASTAPMVTPQTRIAFTLRTSVRPIEWRRGYEPHPDGCVGVAGGVRGGQWSSRLLSW